MNPIAARPLSAMRPRLRYASLSPHSPLYCSTGQEDYYTRLIKENDKYWADVQLPNGKWVTRLDTSKKAKRARHRRYVKKGWNAVFQGGDPDEGMGGDEGMGEDEGMGGDEGMEEDEGMGHWNF